MIYRYRIIPLLVAIVLLGAGCQIGPAGDGLLDPWEVDPAKVDPAVDIAGFDILGDRTIFATRDQVFGPYGEPNGYFREPDLSGRPRKRPVSLFVHRPDPLHEESQGIRQLWGRGLMHLMGHSLGLASDNDIYK